MKKQLLDSMNAEAMRDLDLAPSTLTREERARAEEIYGRIVSSPMPPRAVIKGTPRRRRLWLPAGLLGAVGVAAPALLLGGGSAFASWTATPVTLSGTDVTDAATTCHEALDVPAGDEQVVVAERRGEWTYVLLAGPRSELVCLMPESLVGSEDPASHKSEGFMGSIGEPWTAPSPSPRRILEVESGSTAVPTEGLWGFRDDEEWVTSVQGRVGRDVEKVTVHTPLGDEVEASVSHGRFAAWWPSPVPSSKNPEASGRWTYTVTLADGTVDTL